MMSLTSACSAAVRSIGACPSIGWAEVLNSFNSSSILPTRSLSAVKVGLPNMTGIDAISVTTACLVYVAILIDSFRPADVILILSVSPRFFFRPCGEISKSLPRGYYVILLNEYVLLYICLCLDDMNGVNVSCND